MVRIGAAANVSTKLPSPATALRLTTDPTASIPAGAAPPTDTETVTLVETLPAVKLTLAEPSVLVAVPPPDGVTRPAAGGDRPLLVFAFGSGAEPSVPAGAEVAPSDWVVGVVPASVPPEPPEPFPVALSAPVVEPTPGPSPDCPDGDDVEDCVPVGPVALVVSGAVSEVVPAAPVPVDAVIVTVLGSAGADTDVVSVPPTTDVSTGGAGGAVVRSELPEVIVPDCGAETDNVLDDEICVSVDVLVVPGSCSTARKRGAVGSVLVGPVLVGSAGAASPPDTAAGVDVSAGAAGVAGAVDAGAGVAGSCTGAPTDSETVGVDWNRSTGVFVRAIPDPPATSEYESVTTGTRLRTAVGDVVCAAPAAFDARNGGSGATRCNVGTRSSGSAALGTVRVVRGVVGPANDCWRSAATIGPTYMRASTEMPMPAHQ
jgi:hypothetical protein